MKAIPTDYAGVRFRSRLEAKWAAFFDAAGWRWTYEPYDLNNWIPDFALHFKEPVLVEVKPALSESELAAHAPKIDAAGFDREVLLVGADVGLVESSFYGVVAIGLLRDQLWSEPGGAGTWGAAVPFVCGCCGRMTFGHDIQSFACRVGGCWDGDHYMTGDMTWPTRVMRQAQNNTQWRSPKFNYYAGLLERR